jgi:hypothetical protein
MRPASAAAPSQGACLAGIRSNTAFSLASQRLRTLSGAQNFELGDACHLSLATLVKRNDELRQQGDATIAGTQPTVPGVANAGSPDGPSVPRQQFLRGGSDRKSSFLLTRGGGLTFLRVPFLWRSID